MAKNIIYAAIGLLLVVGIWYWWNQHQQMASLNNGGVTSTDSATTNKSRMDSGAVDLDGHATNETVDPATGLYTNTPTAKPSTPIAPVTTPTTAGGNMPAQPVNTAYDAGSPPNRDTLSANSPNGMAFGGSGKFQWYRQGAITWRINTQSGSTCIAFATMEEWAKPIVYTHGCGNA